MATSNKKTEATTVAQKNTNEAVTTETSVELELTAEQKIEAKIEAKYGAKALAGRKSIKAIVNELENGKNQLTMNTLSLGYTLVDTYKNLLNEERKDFWEFIDTKTRSQKTMERAIELVLESSVKLSEAMDATGGTDDIEENVKSLVLDKGVLKLYENNLANVNKPTIAKIRNMKGLSIEDWNITYSGKSDKPYKAYMEEQSDIEKEEKEKTLLLDKPASMSDKTFLGYCKDNAASITAIHDRNIVIEKNKKKISKLEANLEYYKNLVSDNSLSSKKDSELGAISEDNLSNVYVSESEKA